ncbi:helix-turn-helix domain-containing protein [Rhodobacterales bacterium]|nr:helix-turn-helix domain-containing protein [Rhodobacterales bacterium]
MPTPFPYPDTEPRLPSQGPAVRQSVQLQTRASLRHCTRWFVTLVNSTKVCLVLFVWTPPADVSADGSTKEQTAMLTKRFLPEDGIPGLTSYTLEDPGMQANLQPWVEMECLQLSHGRRVADFDCLNLGRQKIVRERQSASVQKVGRATSDFCTVSISSQDATARFSEHSCAVEESIFFMPGGMEFDIHVPAGGETVYAGFSQQEFLQCARILNPKEWERPPPSVLALKSPYRVDFKAALEFGLQLAQDFDGSEEPLHEDILRAHVLQTALDIVVSGEDGHEPSHSERLRALEIGKKARAFVEAQLDSATLPTLVNLCTELGISERTLRYAMQQYVGLSPTVYLRRCRLNRVRALLAAADPQETTVTQAAMHFGFLHLGRFAGHYRRMFAETPSQTLAS